MTAPVAGAAPARSTVIGLMATFVAFELAWFACVLGAAHGRPATGVAVVGAVIAVLLWRSDKPAADTMLIVAAVVIGLVWDSMLASQGWIVYAEPSPLPAFAPAWILALWALFAITLRAPLRWLHTRLALAALWGAVGGPLSYLGAQRLGACRLHDQHAALVALALGWAVITPLLLLLARRLDSRGNTPADAR